MWLWYFKGHRAITKIIWNVSYLILIYFFLMCVCVYFFLHICFVCQTLVLVIDMVINNYGTIPYFGRLCVNVSYIVIVFGFCYCECAYGWLCNTVEMFWSYYGIMLYFGFISIMIMLYFVQIYFAGSAVLVEKYSASSFIL